MMTNSSICRIGVFYDGSFFAYAQRYLYHERQLGWLSFQPLHSFFEEFLGQKEQGYTSYKVVYASWHQGLFTAKNATEEQLRSDRNLYHDLMHAGIEPRYLPVSQQEKAVSQQEKEKGTDIAMAVDALQVGLDGKIDIAILVTGDGDFVPLVRALKKQGIRVLAAFFKYTDNQGKPSFINERLRNSCDYAVDIIQLENDKDFKNSFKSLFRKQSDWE
jgi:uncharacterized LabA/DUF88 family protein